MRASILAIILVLSASASACADADNFDVEVSSDVQIPAATPLETVLGSFPQLDGFTKFDLAQTQEFKNERYSPDDVDSVVLQRLTMSVVDPPGQDLSFFGTVTFTIETDGQPPLQLAVQDTFPEGATSVNFDVTSADLKRYVLAREATVTTDVTNTSRPDQQTTVRVTALFDVDVKVL